LGMNQVLDPAFITAGAKLIALQVKKGVRTFVAVAAALKKQFGKNWEKVRAAFQSMWDSATGADESLEEVSRADGKRMLDELDAEQAPEKTKTKGKVDTNNRSKGPALGTLSPENIARGVEDALARIEEETGKTIDEWVAEELGYASVEDLWYQPGKDINGERRPRLAAEQVDGIALAINQAKKGGALVIGDETGIGKGRQAAGIMRWAMRQGYIPVFFTADPKLFTDMYGDMDALGFADQWKPLLLANDEKGKIRSEDGSMVLRAPPKNGGAQKKAMDEMLAKGLGSNYNAIALNFAQVNQENDRSRFLEKLGEQEDLFIVIDEAHQAAGQDSAQGTFMRGGPVVRGKGSARRTIVYRGFLNASRVKGVVYLSATWAKVPENMAVYYRTQLGKTAGSMEQLTTAIKSGGVALQQIVADGLAGAGQMIRRERDFSGTTFSRPVVQAENKAKLTADIDKSTRVLREIIDFSEKVRERIADLNEQSQGTAQTAAQLDYTPFANTAHNSIAYLALALKVDAVADMAIAAHKRGEKPVIVLMNTGEGVMNEMFDAKLTKYGSKASLTYNDLLQRTLDRTLRASVDNPMGGKDIVPFTPEDLDMRDEYDAIMDSIGDIDIDVPMSPIDAILEKLTTAGIRVGEMTGRESRIAYDAGSRRSGTYEKMDKADKNALVRDFNGGALHALLLNASGATGLSIHASPAFKERPIKPRHMIIAQAHLDIATMVQILGRIRRTNMITGGAIYSMPTLPLEVERRPAMMLERKLKSLNANTTADTEGQIALESEDFFNKYGDQVVAEFLHENDNYRKLTRLFIKLSDAHEPRPSVEDFARVFAGRLAYLPDQMQREAYKKVMDDYRVRVKELKDSGEYDLEVMVYDDWDGVMRSDEVLQQGTDESNNLMASLRLQQWEIKDTRHRATAAEMQREFTKNIGSKENFAKTLATRVTEYRQRFRELDQRFAADITRVQKELAAASILAKSGDAKATAEQARLIDLEASYKASQRGLASALATFNQVTIPLLQQVHKASGKFITVWDQHDKDSQSKIGMIVGLAVKKQPDNGVLLAPSDFFVTILTNLPGGRMRVPLSQINSGDIVLDSSLIPVTEAEINKKPDNPRYSRFFLVGNPIRAFVSTGLARGKVVSFKSRADEKITGVIMPMSWSPANMQHDPRFDFFDPDTAAAYVTQYALQSIQNGLVTVGPRKPRSLRDGQAVFVPANKAGSLYSLDDKLVRILGVFNKSGNKMVVGVDPADMPAVLKRVAELTQMPWQVPLADRDEIVKDKVATLNAAAAAAKAKPKTRFSVAAAWRRGVASFGGRDYAPDDTGFTAVSTMAALGEPGRIEATRLLQAEIDALTASGAKAGEIKKANALMEALRVPGNAKRFTATKPPPHMTFAEGLAAMEDLPFGRVIKGKVQMVFQPGVEWDAYYRVDTNNQGSIVVNLAHISTARRLQEVIEHEVAHRIATMHPEFFGAMAKTLSDTERAAIDASIRQAYAKIAKGMTDTEVESLMADEVDVRIIETLVREYRAKPWFMKLVAQFLRVAHQAGIAGLTRAGAQAMAARGVVRAFDPKFKGPLAIKPGELANAPANYFHTPELSKPFSGEPWAAKLAHWGQWGYKAGGVAERMGRHTKQVLGSLAANKLAAKRRYGEAQALLKELNKRHSSIMPQLVAAINGTMKWSEIDNTSDPVVQKAIALARQVRARVDALSTALVAAGVAKDQLALTILANRGTYQTVIYQKFINDGWVPQRQVQQAAMDEILASLYRVANIKTKQVNTVLKRLVQDNPERATALLEWLQGQRHDHTPEARGLTRLEELARDQGQELTPTEIKAMLWLRGAYKGLADTLDNQLEHAVVNGVPSVYITKTTAQFFDTAQGVLAWLIAKDTTLERFRKAEGGGAPPAWRAVRSQLMHRTEMSPVIRELFGEIKDLAEVAYLTELRQQNMLTQFEFQRQLWEAQDGLALDDPDRFLFSTARRSVDAAGKVRSFTHRLPDDAKYGPLRAKWTDVNTYGHIVTGEQQARVIEKALVSLNGIWRSMMVFYNAASYPRQTLGSILMAWSAGEANRPKFGKNLARSAKAIIQRGPEYEALTKASVVGADTNVLDTEITASLRDAANAVGLIKIGDSPFADWLRTYWSKVGGVAKRGHELMRQAFVAGDDVVKIAVYYNMLDRGMTEQEAVDQTRKILPYYDMAPKAVTDVLRRVGPDFITFKMELLRNQVNMVELVYQDLAAKRFGDAVFRLTGAGTMLYFGTALGAAPLAWAMTAILGGDNEPPDEEELEAAVGLRPEYTEGNAAVFWRGKNGELYLVDYGFTSPYELQNTISWILTLPDLTVDQKMQKMVAAMVQYFAAGGFGSGLTGAAKIAVNVNPRNGRKVWEPGDDALVAARKVLGTVYSHFSPGTLTKLERANEIRKNNGQPIVDATGQERTMANQLWGTVTPLSVQRVVPEALLLNHAYAYASSLQGKKRDVTSMGKRVEAGQTVADNLTELEESHTAANDREWAMFRTRVGYAIKLGVPVGYKSSRKPNTVRGILKQAGLKAEDADALIREWDAEPLTAD
jgi:hypothetical protein